MEHHTSPHETHSVLASLRQLLPARPLTLSEAMRLAELQANRLRALLRVETSPFPSEAICELPRVRVEYDADMPCSGASDWDEHHRSWVITLNAIESATRQRFSMLHEYKHIIDHGSVGLIGQSLVGYTGDTPAIKQLADYFAACVLMPKRLVKAAWGELRQNPFDLAAEFDVSPQAMTIRLQQLGLVQPQPRCVHLAGPGANRRYRYQRAASPIIPPVEATL